MWLWSKRINAVVLIGGGSVILFDLALGSWKWALFLAALLGVNQIVYRAMWRSEKQRLEELAYLWWLDYENEKLIQPHITCPTCGMTSYNPNDIQYRYCGNCHAFLP